MASALASKRLAFGTLAVLLTAAGLWLGTGLDPWWPATWLAPLPVLLFAAGARWWSAALAAFLAMVLGMLNLWQLFHALHLRPGTLLTRYAAWGAVFAAAVALWRALLRRGAPWAALVAFPALLVSFEWLLNLTGLHGTGGSLAYTQLRFLAFLQLASITGPWGMSFVLLLVPSALALAWHLRPRSAARAWAVLALVAAVLVVVVEFGAVRLAFRNPAEARVKVGLVASDQIANEDVADEGVATARLFQAYAREVRRLAARGARVVVLPEKLGVEVAPGGENAAAIFQPVADETGVAIVAGMIAVRPPQRYNEARVFRPHQPVLAYDKEHLLPPFESKLTPGTALTTFAAPASTWGVAICKDMDFTQLGRRYGRRDAGLMLVPGWDFFLDWIQHGHMAIMRGVESGFAVVRAAKGGSLYASDDRGRILAEVKSDAAPFTTLLVDVPVGHDATLFLRFGDWFAWVAVIALALALVRLVARWNGERTAPINRPG
jgi:apolipoprotein N-acyltransferase